MTRIENYYMNLGKGKKMVFARRIIELTGASLNGVLNWCRAYTKPADPKVMKILSQETGIPVDELYTHF